MAVYASGNAYCAFYAVRGAFGALSLRAIVWAWLNLKRVFAHWRALAIWIVASKILYARIYF